MKIIGLDAGSVSVKAVLLDTAGSVVRRHYQKHKGHAVQVAMEILRAFGTNEGCAIALTGSASKLIASVLGAEPVNELVAHTYATKRLHPHVRTIIEMGGEDSKLILLDETGMKDFSMNSVCAAGTGSFLDQQAERLRLSIEEFGELALKSKKPPRIAGRCSVFAKSDMIHLQQIATPVEEIVAGLCFAVARNFKGSIARGRKIIAPVSFQGGVAANQGMVRAFREILELDDLFVPPDFALMGALGAAMKARDEGSAVELKIDNLREFLSTAKDAVIGHPPLLKDGDEFTVRHLKDSRDIVHALPTASKPLKVYMGIDIGSISTNVAVIDSEGILLSKRYLMTAGRPIEAVRQGLREITEELGSRVEIAGVGTTGSGRYMIADYVGADIVKNEITAQATAAAFIDPAVDTIFEIGGQDSKYIALENGVIVDFEMNKACAAGTGSFLEEQAEKLNVAVKREFAASAFASACPSRLGERCTVFMENSLMANLQKGTSQNDLLAGLAYSIVQNYINRVVAGRRVGRNIFFLGGVAFNKSVVAAFEKYLDTTVTVPPNHDVTGAIGMALIAMRHMSALENTVSDFKGFGRVQRPYEISTFGCNSCSNMCEINRVKVEGEKQILFYGGRCEKYDINKKVTSHISDLFKFRDELLNHAYQHHTERLTMKKKKARGKLGIPSIFFFNDYLPHWTTLLDHLGFDIVLSPRPNRQIVDLGLEGVLSEACFPVKVAIGHLRFLKEQGVDAIFLPSFVNLNAKSEEYPLGASCPHTQSIPYVGRVAVPGIDILAPVIDRSMPTEKTIREIKKSLKRFGVSTNDIRSAMKVAEDAQKQFTDGLRKKGNEVLSGLREKTIVIIGRAYNALDRGMNLRIPEKLATLDVMAIPMDMLPLGDVAISEDWPEMYWRSGQQMLRAARFIADHEKLYPIVIGNFSCGPDSFILKYIKDELKGKPFLHIEIDEHSADAGAITRCEAFLDSIGHHSSKPIALPSRRKGAGQVSFKDRLVYIPPMCDHAHAVSAAFERCGVHAEVLPESDRESVDIGMKYVSGKECYPCLVTTGDMLKKAFSKGFEPSRSAFFMPSGTGPCRFGQYNVFHKRVLESAGLGDVPVFAPNQDNGFYDSLGEVSSDFVLQCWKGIVSIELLTKCLHESRPYENRSGSANELYQHHLRRLVSALAGKNGGVEKSLKEIRKDFESLPKTNAQKPHIGVIGEIFVRSSKFSNENVVKKIEALGGEVWLAPVEEWNYYANYLDLQHALARGDYPLYVKSLITRYFQKRIEHCYARLFKGYLRTADEPSTAKVLKNAAPYLHHSFEGETVLSIGKSVDFAGRGVAGIVNAMPFGCMPGTIVTALIRAVTNDHHIPSINIAYDGTEASTNDIQLEAFMNQAIAVSNA